MRADASARSLLALLMAWTLLPNPSSAQSGEAPSPSTAAQAYVVGGGLENVQLSPDGERIAGMVRTASGFRALVSRKLDGSDQKVAYRLDKPGMDLQFLRWLGNDKFLLRLSNNQELVMGQWPWPISRLLVIGMDGSKPKVLSNPKSSNWYNHMSQEVTPACPGASMVMMPTPEEEEAHGTVGRFDANASRWLTSGSAPRLALQMFSDAQDVVRLAVRAQDKGSTRLERLVKTSDGAIGRFTPWKPKALEGVAEVQDLGISADGKYAYLLVEVPSGAEVWRLSTLQEDAPPEILARLDQMPSNFSVLRHGKRCEPVGLNAVGQTWTWADDLDRLVGGVQAAFSDTRLELLAWQGDRYLARVGSVSRPTEYLAGIRSTHSLARVGTTHPNLEEALPLHESKLTLPGVPQSVKLLTSTAGNGPRPTLLCIDCHLHLSDNQGTFKSLEAYWATSGWAVVTSPLSNIPVYDSFRRTQDYLMHWQRVLDGLVAQGVTQRQQVVAVALSSDAGRLALLLGQGEQARVQGVATLGALTDVPTYADRANNSELGAGYRAKLDRYFRGLNRQALEERSPLHQVNQQRAQVLLMHADHDGAVEAQNARAMHSALQALKRPSTLLILKDSTEQIDHPPYRLAVMQAIDELLASVRRTAESKATPAR